MKAFSNFFKGKVLEETNSPFNGKIQVIEFLGRRKITTNGLIQSGGVLKDIWKKGLKAKSLKLKAKNILILGLGGGTVAKLVSKKWPKAKIVGVEIDPAMIKFGKKYFDLGKIVKLKIINTDAISWVKKNATKQKFDLVLIDLYKGEEMPKKIAEKKFLESLKKTVRKNGVIIFNCLFYREHKEKAKKFIKKLGAHFDQISLTRVLSNLMVYCSTAQDDIRGRKS